MLCIPMRALLGLTALSCAVAQEVTLTWYGRDTVGAAEARMRSEWWVGETQLMAEAVIIAGIKRLMGLVPRGLRIDAVAGHWVRYERAAVGILFAHTSTHHIDTWAHRVRYGAIYSDWRMQLGVRVWSERARLELIGECVPYRALYAPDYVVGLPRWWITAAWTHREGHVTGQVWTRIDVEQRRMAESRLLLGLHTGRVWTGVVLHWLTHDWYEPGGFAARQGAFLVFMP